MREKRKCYKSAAAQKVGANPLAHFSFFSERLMEVCNMADKKSNVEYDYDEPYDRWATIPGAIKIVGENTPEQQKVIDEINAQRQERECL